MAGTAPRRRKARPRSTRLLPMATLLYWQPEASGGISCTVSGAGGSFVALAGRRRRPGEGSALFHGSCFRHVRRSVCGLELYLGRGGHPVGVADSGPDGTGAGVGRVNVRSPDHGHPVRWVLRGLERPWSLLAPTLRHTRAGTTYATFLPCFLFIFLLAPYIELLANNRRLCAILVGVTVAIFGVVANLAVFSPVECYSRMACQ